MDILNNPNDFHDDSMGLIRDLTLQIAYYRSLLETFERDALTGFYRREKFDEYIKLSETAQSTGIIFFDVNGLKTVNDNFGHHSGDMLIQKAADSITVFRTDKSEVFRLGGDEFSAVLFNFQENELKNLVISWNERLNELNKDGIKCEIAHGVAFSKSGDMDFTVSELLQQADERMYENKRTMKKGEVQ